MTIQHHPNVAAHRLPGRQRGQALTEFLVVALALVPLFLLMPMIGKYQDIAHATQMAARYVAFDSTVRNGTQNSAKSDAQIQDEVRRRFFSNSDAPIKTNDVAGDFKANQNLFWRDPTDKPLIKNFTDITVTRSTTGTNDGATAFIKTFGGTGIATADVNVAIVKLPAGLKFYQPFDTLDMSMTRRAAVLVDPWTGKSPDDVNNKSNALVPTTYVAQVTTLLDLMFLVSEPGLSPPNIGRDDFWTDLVPPDRLTNY